MTKRSLNMSPEVRAAIAAFLSACQQEARPFATSEALGAVRRMFPDLDISDTDLMNAITSEAFVAGFDVDTPNGGSGARVRRSHAERDGEGGAPRAIKSGTNNDRVDRKRAGKSNKGP